jgi:phytoene dehydrogenase-like protein
VILHAKNAERRTQSVEPRTQNVERRTPNGEQNVERRTTVSAIRDAIVIGGGHNGLVAAALLAKAGLKPLVLERADQVGGSASTTELLPGFRCPTLAHRAAIDPFLVRTLELARHGLQFITPEAHVCTPDGHGRAVMLWHDVARTARDLSVFSAGDAHRYPDFLASLSAITRVMRGLLDRAAPPIDDLRPPDIIALLATSRRFRKLQRADAYRLLRYLPMSVADLAEEWFESEPLRATLAAAGVFGAPVGPRSAGSGAVLLLLASQGGHPAAPGWQVRGGTGSVGQALLQAATAAGAEVRGDAGVAKILVRDERAIGVVLASGEEIAARRVVSSLDPRRTLIDLVDPLHLPPEFRRRVRNIRMRGVLAKVNYAVDALPSIAINGQRRDGTAAAMLSGCIRLGTGIDQIERAFDAAKYGEIADLPWVELSIPSLQDPDLAPRGRHVVSAYVQFVPYVPETAAAAQREHLARTVTRTIEQYAPGFGASVVAQQVITPFDLERRYGLTGGHVFHGELALDQLLIARPLLGWARYRTPIRDLYLCGSGTHPGDGLTGRAGALASREILADARAR